MYILTKKMEVSGGHCLDLPYTSKCTNLHGHNWWVTVEIMGKKLNPEGMLLDFGVIKNVVNQLDHQNLNDILPDINPTAENIAKWIADQIIVYLSDAWDQHPDRPNVSEVIVQESEGNICHYRPDFQ